jgi:hypothetical protein
LTYPFVKYSADVKALPEPPSTGTVVLLGMDPVGDLARLAWHADELAVVALSHELGAGFRPTTRSLSCDGAAATCVARRQEMATTEKVFMLSPGVRCWCKSTVLGKKKKTRKVMSKIRQAGNKYSYEN